MFVEHAKAANLCVTKLGQFLLAAYLPSSNVTARAIIANKKRVILVCGSLILVFKVLDHCFYL